LNLKMKELPLSERPYEKIELYGAETLSNSELLAIIIKSGTKEETVINLAQRVLNLNNTKDNNLRFLQNISIAELMKIKGIGKVKAIQLKAVSEIAKRMSKPINTGNIEILNPADVANLLMEELRYEKREIVKLLILNNKNVVVKILEISRGGTDFANFTIKEVLIEAIKSGEPKVILVHNHPSGDATPSQNDYVITDSIYEVADVLGIELIDHIIIGDGVYKSLLQSKEREKFI